MHRCIPLALLVACGGSETTEPPPPDGPPATAEIAYVDQSGSGVKLLISNSDGEAAVVIGGNAGKPSWSGVGAGTKASPWRLAYQYGISQIAVTDVDTVGGKINLGSFRVIPLAGPATLLQWKPGSDSIAIRADDGSLGLASVATGGVLTLYRSAEAGRAVSIFGAWRRAGDAIAFLESGAGPSVVKVLDRVTGVVNTIAPPGLPASVLDVDWARTRDELAIGHNEAATDATWLVSLDRAGGGGFLPTGTPRLLTSQRGATWSPDDSRLAVRGLRVVSHANGEVLWTLGSGAGLNAAWRP